MLKGGVNLRPFRRGNSYRSPFLSIGLPVIGFVLVGSVGLSHFIYSRNEIKDNKYRIKYDSEVANETRRTAQQRVPFVLEEEYEVILSL